MLSALVFATLTALGDDLQTVAERSDFHATSRYSEVMDLCRSLVEASKGTAKLTTLATSTEGREIPLLIVADPPVSTPEEAAKSGKLVALVIANIHAGEVDGKEGLLMLLREIVSNSDDPLHKEFDPARRHRSTTPTATRSSPSPTGPARSDPTRWGFARTARAWT